MHRLSLFTVAIAYTLLVCVCSDFVTSWGYWYSPSAAYRQQSDALLAGRLSLSDSPSDLAQDLSWSEKGVHQVWGLGVPAWRAMFELLARAVGASPFPDRLAFLAAVLGTAYLTLLTFFEGSHWNLGTGAASIALLIWPPFFTLCRSRFAVYEEAVAYAYLCGLALLMLLLRFAAQPKSILRLALLMLAAGWAPLVRPTLLFYSFASVLLAAFLARRARVSWPALLGCALLCVAGLALLAFTNERRFGAASEFGHSLNVSGIWATVFATRFGHPFGDEPLSRAARELFSLLFLRPNLNGSDFFRERFFLWQSPTPRWRELYLTTFDLSYALLCLAALASLFLLRKRLARNSPVFLIVAWGSLSCLLLAAFYVRCPCIASRYLLDFSAGLAAIVSCLAVFACATRAKWIVFAVFCAWVVTQWSTTEFSYAREQPVSRNQLNTEQPTAPYERQVPGDYNKDTDFEAIGIPFNGFGWDARSGTVDSVVTLFVKDPDQVRIDIKGTCPTLRVKVGLEELNRLSVTEENGLTHFEFSSPHLEKYQRGIQPMFIAFPSNHEFHIPYTRARLIGVSSRHNRK